MIKLEGDVETMKTTAECKEITLAVLLETNATLLKNMKELQKDIDDLKLDRVNLTKDIDKKRADMKAQEHDILDKLYQVNYVSRFVGILRRYTTVH